MPVNSCADEIHGLCRPWVSASQCHVCIKINPKFIMSQHKKVTKDKKYEIKNNLWSFGVVVEPNYRD